MQKGKDRMDDSLHVAFEADMLDIYERTKRECGYNSTRFLQMIRRHGGVEAARRVLRRKDSGKPSKGWEVLRLCNRPDLSAEWLVLKEEYHSLFTEEERAIAQERLAQLTPA